MNIPWSSGREIAGKYTLVRRVGVGGMSEVWSAKNEMTGATVALKLLRPDASGTGDAAARFRHEAMVGAQLDHRNIARVYDFLEEEDGTLALVMALLRGKSLSQHLKECKHMPEREAVAVALGVLAALGHAHDYGILHRDIKPGNVFLCVDPDGLVTPKLLDFGIAKLSAGGVLTRDGTFLGTPQYMAPERIRDAGPVDARSDLFSVGVLLYEMLSGVSPFEKTSVQASLVAVLEEGIEPDPIISPFLWQAIRELIAKAAADRPANATTAAEALRGASGNVDYTIRWAPQAVGKVSLDAAPSSRMRERTSSAELQAGEPTNTHASLALPRRRNKFVVWTILGLCGLMIAGALLSKACGPSSDPSVAIRTKTGKTAALQGPEPDLHAVAAQGSQTATAPPTPPTGAIAKGRPRPLGKRPDF